MHLRKRCAVTGGAGFLGSHLCERLLKEQQDVLCIDNLYTGSKRNIVGLLGNPYFELMRHDITYPMYIEVDEIYNLACPASPIHYQNDPVQTTKVNVHGSINMLGTCKASEDKDHAGLHLRGLRQSLRTSAKGDLLGEREPYWTTVLLR